MNHLIKLPALCLLGVLASARLFAGFETIKIVPTLNPQLSPAMLMDGITEGKLVVAIDVSAEGRLTDWLVLGYTHPGLVRPCIDALKTWTFIPAKLDGQPVPVQLDITIDYTAEGVVISRTTLEDLSHRVERIFGYPMISKKRAANELDAAPTVVNSVAPRYARQAEKDGVRGSVLVYFFVDETGAVRMPSVEKSSDPYLSAIAVDAVRSWKFAPPTSHGRPVLISARQEFKFGDAN